MRLLATAAERLFGWIHRFLTEVIASVMTTACVAGVTTLYLSFGGADHAAAPAPAPPQGIAAIFTPAPDEGAPAFIPAAPASKPLASIEAKEPSSPVPPKRPRIAAAEAHRATDPLAAPLVVYEAASAFDALPEPLTLDNGASYEPGAIEQRPLQPMPYAAAEPERERTLLGMPVPAVVPSGGEIVDGVRGIGHAMAALVR